MQQSKKSVHTRMHRLDMNYERHIQLWVNSGEIISLDMILELEILIDIEMLRDNSKFR
jgi:hypothetical protein